MAFHEKAAGAVNLCFPSKTINGNRRENGYPGVYWKLSNKRPFHIVDEIAANIRLGTRFID